MIRTSEIKREIKWEQTYQQILKRKAQRYKDRGLIHVGDILSGNRECYDDCIEYYNDSIDRENAYRAELLRRKELPKRVGMQVARICLAIITLGQFHLMQ